jgi:hypothetical protein
MEGIGALFEYRAWNAPARQANGRNQACQPSTNNRYTRLHDEQGQKNLPKRLQMQ